MRSPRAIRLVPVNTPGGVRPRTRYFVSVESEYDLPNYQMALLVELGKALPGVRLEELCVRVKSCDKESQGGLAPVKGEALFTVSFRGAQVRLSVGVVVDRDRNSLWSIEEPDQPVWPDLLRWSVNSLLTDLEDAQ